MEAALGVTMAADGLTLAVRLTPRGRRDGLAGLQLGPAGPRLAVTVTAPAERGKANAALVELLAKRLHVPKSALTIRVGAQARDKVIHLAGDPGELLERVRALLCPHG